MRRAPRAFPNNYPLVLISPLSVHGLRLNVVGEPSLVKRQTPDLYETPKYSRLAISAAAVGYGKRILECGIDYAIQRKAFGQSIADFQLIQAMLADSQAELVQPVWQWPLLRIDAPAAYRTSCT